MFSQLIFADQLRGTDGTGLFYNRKKKCVVVKHPATASLMFGQKQYKNALTDAIQNGNFLIGHNRAATKGNKVWKDTHPFIEENITLIHNGTLFNHKQLNNKSDVDSHAIAVHMAKNGYHKTLKETDGPFALSWFDSKENSLNFCRNSQRPLSIIETDSVWIISSEAGLGEWIAERNSQKILSSISFETEHVYSFKDQDFTKLHKEKVEFYTWTSTYYGGNYSRGKYHGFGETEIDSYWPSYESSSQTNQSKGVVGKVLSTVTPNPGYQRKQGDYVQFIPNRKYATNEATWWDPLLNRSYFKGIVENEKNACVRIYCDSGKMKEYEKYDKLVGQIVSITFKKDGITYYTLDKATPIVKPLTKTLPLLHDNKTYCEKCAVEIPDDEMKEAVKLKTGGHHCFLCARDEFDSLGPNYDLMCQC